MLTFRTQFPINISTDMQEFMDCCRTWIVKSPHTKLAREIPDGAREGIFGDDDETVSFGFLESETTSSGGVRYEKIDDDEVRWVTDVIGYKTENGFWISVQLNVDSELPVERIEQGKRPYIVKLLMQEFAGGYDGILPVSDSPIFLSNTDADLAQKIICAGAGSVMPSVYVSRNQNEELILDPNLLAKWISGMAHVVVEPNRKFSSQIMRQVYGENVYGGAVAIYWPDGIGKWVYLPSKWDSPNTLQATIVKKIRLSLLCQRLRRECAWSYLQEIISRQKLEALRASGSDNIEEYITHFDKEISAKDEEIQRLETELVRARYSKREIRASDAGECNSINLETPESDLYQGEQLGLIIECLKAAAISAEPHSRRRNLLDALVVSNDNPGDREEILDRLKELLRQYTSMTALARAELEALGFTISEDGKHYKLLFQDDTRYPFILPKTGSDRRGGLNAFSALKKTLF